MGGLGMKYDDAMSLTLREIDGLLQRPRQFSDKDEMMEAARNVDPEAMQRARDDLARRRAYFKGSGAAGQ